MKKIVLSLFLSMILCCSSLSFSFAETIEHQEEAWFQVHFGMGIGDLAVTPQQLENFIDTELSLVFPQGLTVIMGKGQWDSPKIGFIKEQTAIIEIFAPNNKDSEQKIQDVAGKYVKQFASSKVSVFIVTVPHISTKIIF